MDPQKYFKLIVQTFAPASKKRPSSTQDEEINSSERQCCTEFSSSRPMKSGKTQHKQSISPCTIHCQKYNHAVDLIESGSIQQAVPILKSLLADHDTDGRTDQLDPSNHNVLIKASIKLATAYRILSRPSEALETLEYLFLPNQKLYISFGHNLFGEAAVIYAHAKDELTRQKESKTISKTEFRIRYVETCLCRMGREFMKLGKYAPALKLFDASICEAKRHGDDGLSSHSLKQIYIQALLDSIRCHLALQSPSDAKSILYTLNASERSLSLTYNNPKFMEMVRLAAIVDSWNSNPATDIAQRLPEDSAGAYDEGVAYHPECFYQALCILPDSSTDIINSSFRILSRIIHPDKGGDTGIMQKLLLAYGNLKAQGARYSYDQKCRVVHPNVFNQI